MYKIMLMHMYMYIAISMPIRKGYHDNLHAPSFPSYLLRYHFPPSFCALPSIFLYAQYLFSRMLFYLL